MTPRSLDPDSLHEKLQSMATTLDRLRSLGEVDAARLAAEPITRAAVERWLTVLVDLAVSVNLHIASAVLGRTARDYANSFAVAAEAGAIDSSLAARLAPSAGARNVLIHEYVEVDLELVVRALANALDDYPTYVRSVATFVDEARQDGH